MLKTPTTPVAEPLSSSELAVDSTAEKRASERSRPGRSNLWVKAVAITVVLVAAIAAVGGMASRAIPEATSDATLTHTIRRGDLIVSVKEQGTLESANNVEVRSKVWGWKTVNWVIESGSEVKKGDLLVELDDSEMEKKVEDAAINYHNSVADKITAESTRDVAEKSIDEYKLGTFVEEETSILQEIFDANQAVVKAELAYKSTLRLGAKGLIEDIQIQGEAYKLQSAQKTLKLKKTRHTALVEFKQAKMVEKLESDLRAAEARLQAAQARVDLAQTNWDQHKEQLAYHRIVAPQDGMVIHPKAADHRAGPDVEEGANVHTNQVLLIMPDLDTMQVKLGIHESMIDQVKTGLAARVTIGEEVVQGEVSEVATVTKPATWYTGNVVKFDTVVSMTGGAGLKPGLSAEVEVIIAEHKDVLTIPVAAVVEHGTDRFCWVKTDSDAERRSLVLGDSNDLFVVVHNGLKEGDEVVLNPLAFIEEAQAEVLMPLSETVEVEPVGNGSSTERQPEPSSSDAVLAD